MAENKMAEVAKLFGKKLGEEFVINDFDMKFKAKFEKYGMYHMVGKWWIPSCVKFERLLLGRTTIVDD